MASSKRIEHLAATWLARRDGDGWDGAACAALEAWLAESTAHRVAFLRLEATWENSGRLKALGAGIPAGVIPARGQWTRSPFAGDPPCRWVGPDRPVAEPLPGLPDLRGLEFAPRRTAGAPHRRRLAAGVTLSALLAVVLGWGWHHQRPVEHASYLTAMGDLRNVPLSDGSNAVLSSDSRMQVALSRGERRVELEQGEAFFEVAKDRNRPFVVRAGARQVVAVGTRFSVRRDGADLRVVVTEGTVRLQSGDRADGGKLPTTLLQAGSVAHVSKQRLLVRSGTVEEAERQLDWRGGYVTFRDTKLVDAAAEFNRYSPRKIVMGDETVAAMRVGGNFRWSNAEAFVRLLEQGFPVRAESHPDRIVLHSR